jgi:hypothetical protein
MMHTRRLSAWAGQSPEPRTRSAARLRVRPLSKLGQAIRISLALMALVIAVPAAAVEIFPKGNGQYEIVQETGFSYSQDDRLRDATAFCKRHRGSLQVIADLNSLRFACVRRD